jgi:hypothetical protein
MAAVIAGEKPVLEKKPIKFSNLLREWTIKGYKSAEM